MRIRLALAFAFIALAAGAFAQTPKTKSALTSEVSQQFPDNTSGAITPASARTVSDDIITSFQQAPLVNAQTGSSYTILATDYGKLITFSNASAVAVSLPQAIGSFFPWNAYVVNLGAGAVTITPSGSTINGATSLILPTNGSAWIVSDGVNYQVSSTGLGLINPVTVGTSLYPSISASHFHYDANSALIANTLGAKNVVIGVPATDPNVTWLNTYLGGVDSPPTSTAGATTLNVVSPNGFYGIAVGTRSGDQATGTPVNVIASNAVGLHNNNSVAHLVWGGYDAVVAAAGAAASHQIGREIDTHNLGSAAPIQDPFTINPTSSIEALRLASGIPTIGSPTRASSYLVLTNNAANAGAGIVVASGSLDTGLNAIPPAVSLPPQYAVTWYSAAATVSSQAYTGSDGLLHLTSTGAVIPKGGTNSVGSCTNLGTGGTCTLSTGSNNNVGNIILTTGTGSPGANGVVVITFSQAMAADNSNCTFTAKNAGASWTAPVTFQNSGVSTSSYTVTWTNGAALSASQTYHFGYQCSGY